MALGMLAVLSTDFFSINKNTLYYVAYLSLRKGEGERKGSKKQIEKKRCRYSTVGI